MLKPFKFLWRYRSPTFIDRSIGSKKSSIKCSIHPVAANNSFCPSSFFIGLCLVPAISINKVTIVVNVDRTITPCWLPTRVCSRPSLFLIRIEGPFAVFSNLDCLLRSAMKSRHWLKIATVIIDDP